MLEIAVCQVIENKLSFKQKQCISRTSFKDDGIVFLEKKIFASFLKILGWHKQLKKKIKAKKQQKTRAKSSYGTCDEAGTAKSQELIWY